MSKQSELGEKQLQTLLIENIEYWAEGEDAGEIEHKIIFSYGAAVSAILDWHNKQVGVVLDRLEKCLVHVDEHICRFNDGEQVCDCYLEADKITRGAIEAERNKLKERDDE